MDVASIQSAEAIDGDIVFDVVPANSGVEVDITVAGVFDGGGVDVVLLLAVLVDVRTVPCPRRRRGEQHYEQHHGCP